MRTFCGLTTDGMLDYLATIYRLDQRQDKVTTGSLATAMHVTAAAVSSMLKRLEEANLVERSNADGVVLTEQGRLAALQLIRRHRLLEVFLMQVMGYTWDQVDMEAHRLEHAISTSFEERMDALCGHPTRCPHGDPIPTQEGVMPPDPSIPLLEAPRNTSLCLRRVDTDDPRILRYLAQLGLTPGQDLMLLDIAPFKGPVTVMRLGEKGRDSQEMLGHELAQLLFVEPGPEEREGEIGSAVATAAERETIA